MTSPADIRLLVLDVDGVMTDGSIMIDDNGVETKRFNVRDGQGIVTWIRLGFDVAIITRRSGEVVKHRCKELGISRIVQGCKNKAEAIHTLAAETGIPPSQMAYIGDDWPDLAALAVVGYPIIVSDAAPDLRPHAAFITTRSGGHGAVREAIEHILFVKGLLTQAAAHYR